MIKKFLALMVCILLSAPVFAEETNTDVSEDLLRKIDEENITDAEKQPEIEIIRKVEHKIAPLPACDNPVLYEKTKAFITAYFEKMGSLGTLYRRHQYFLLRDLNKFQTEDVSAYKTVETQTVANAIANAEVNFSLNDDNLRLCKNTSKNKYAKDLYLLIFPKDDGYIVQILNMMPRQVQDNLDISFFYQDENLISQE